MAAKVKVLVVEHKTPLGMEMAFLLTCAGREVRVANTGKSGMKLALENEFDLFVVEVDLPDINGFEICRKLKQVPISRTAPVVFVSARSSDQDVQHGFQAGAADYIATPFEATDFIFRIVSQAKVKTSPLKASSRKEAAGLQVLC